MLNRWNFLKTGFYERINASASAPGTDVGMGGSGDRFGRARMLRYGLAVFALSSLGAALAQSPAQLIGARAIMGMGGAMMMPATLAVIVNVFKEKEMPKAIAIWAMMGRDRRRAWTDPWRAAAQVLLLGVSVPGERADCRDRDCSKPISSCRIAETLRAGPSTFQAHFYRWERSLL